jgi:tetrahydrodipicolinate N-succinyltransferase
MPGIQINDGLWVGLNTSIDWEGTRIEGPVYIGSGTRIEAGVHIVGRPGSVMAATFAPARKWCAACYSNTPGCYRMFL